MKDETKMKIGEVVAMILAFPIYILFTPFVFIMGGIYRVGDLWRVYFTGEEIVNGNDS